jgi:hypothetical protein
VLWVSSFLAAPVCVIYIERDMTHTYKGERFHITRCIYISYFILHITHTLGIIRYIYISHYTLHTHFHITITRYTYNFILHVTRTGERQAISQMAFARGNVQVMCTFQIVPELLFDRVFRSLCWIVCEKRLFKLTSSSSTEPARTVCIYIVICRCNAVMSFIDTQSAVGR